MRAASSCATRRCPRSTRRCSRISRRSRATRRPLKRVIYLNEGGDRVVEAAVVLSPAPSGAEVTAGEIHVVLHPLRALPT